MNKIIFLCIFTFSIVPNGMKAQLGFDGGVKVSAITSQVAGDTYAGYNKIGISGGAFVKILFSDKSATKLEILYTQKGSRNKQDPKNPGLNYYRLAFNYIEIPLSYVYSKNLLNVEAGLYYGILLSSSQDTGGGEVAVTPPYFKYDVGGQLGVLYYLIEEKLALGIKWSNSILPIRTPPSGTPSGLAYISGGYNSALLLGLEYTF